MLKREVIQELIEIVGSANVYSAKEDLLCYAGDATFGFPAILPAAVVKPASAEEVSRILRLANRQLVPVVPRGAGTSLSGGAMPVQGGIVLETTRMNRILEIDTDNLLAVVEPGVIAAKFHQTVEQMGLFFPPDPGSLAFSTLGGNVAVCAGGLRGLKYGVVKDYVLGLEVVMPWGGIVNTGGRTVKNVTGYDLTRLMVGSEGTLGVITKIIFKLLPLPAASRSMLAIFDNLNNAGETIAAIIRNKIIPATLEVMDNTTIRAVEAAAKIGLPVDAEAILLVEVDGAEQVVEEDLKKVIDICRAYQAKEIKIAHTPEEKAQVWSARRNAYGSLAKINNTILVEDATVPRSKVPEMISFLVETAKRNNLIIATLGHAGDGNLHPCIVFDRDDPDTVHRVEKATEEIFRKGLGLGGTLSGEHGIGIGKKRFLHWEAGDEGIEAMARIKAALDPNNILNPGKVFSKDRGVKQ
ncbi:MAG: FAD-binding oxidoreductase [Bacillota bacterium]